MDVHGTKMCNPAPAKNLSGHLSSSQPFLQAQLVEDDLEFPEAGKSVGLWKGGGFALCIQASFRHISLSSAITSTNFRDRDIRP